MRKRKPSGGLLLLLLLVKMPDFCLQGPPGPGLYSISGTVTKRAGGRGAAHKKRLSCCQDADEDEDEDEDDVGRCQRTTT